ncbi:glycerophosphodiester phosphodiesterase, partial [Klebsiella pneumoniae]
EGDYFEFEAFQDSEGDRQFRADPYTWFSIEAIELETETMEKDFMLIGHRGATGYTDEHTIKGYQMALDKGADYIELDLQLTKDNKLLCMHDSTIDRTTTGTGKVGDMTLSYIQTNFTSLNGEPIPSLDDVLNHFGTKVKYYIETKRPFDANMDRELLTQLKAKGLIGIGSERFQVIIQSFARESLINIHNQFSNIPLAYLTSTFSESEMDDCLSYGFYAIAPKYTTITKELVDLAHSKGLKVHAWTVNTKEEMQSLIQMGVDGFFTNYCGRSQ